MDKSTIIAALEQEFANGIEFAYLFGSFASGRATENSDIDIAILPCKPLNPMGLWKSTQALSRVFKKEVDLINLMNCNTILRYQIVSEGCFIFGNRKRAALFETDTFRMYQDLQFNRQDNIEGFWERWKINDCGDK